MPRRQRSPNVVLIISDEQRADTMPGVRTADVSTPHLEWLAAQGTLFRNAYCVTPICSPARAALLSGLYPHTTGMVANHQESPISNELHLSPDVRLLADYLQPLGYACAYTGKWHLGTGGDRRGFRDFVTRVGYYDVDGPEQNDILRFAARVGVTLGGKKAGHDADPARFCARTRVGSSLLPLAFHPSLLNARAAARWLPEATSLYTTASRWNTTPAIGASGQRRCGAGARRVGNMWRPSAAMTNCTICVRTRWSGATSAGTRQRRTRGSGCRSPWPLG